MSSVNNVLLLGQGATVDQYIELFQKHNISYLSITDNPALLNYQEFSDLRKQPKVPLGLTQKLAPDIFFGPQLKSWIDDQQFKPEWIVNCYDQKLFLEIEQQLGYAYQINNALSASCAQFFAYKSVQDHICKQLDIPTLPATSSAGLCVKRDYKPISHESFSVPKFRWESEDYVLKSNEFAQAWCDFDAIFNLHIAVDAQARWTLIECAKLDIERSMVIHEWSPWIPTSAELEQIESILKKLKHALDFNYRVCHYQLARIKGDSTLYNLDWNSRLGGDSVIKSLGKEIGSFDLLSGLWDATQFPHSLEYTKLYRGDTIWYHNLHRFESKDPIRLRAWWQDPTVAWTWKIYTAEHSQLRLTNL